MTNTIKVQLLHNLLDEVSGRYDYLYDANRNALEKIQYSASHDTLTGLANRVAFEENLERSISAAKRHGDIGAVLFMDLDNFKQVNDTIGHEEGDQLLCDVANKIKPQLREEDFFARFGGDEFVILIERISDDVDRAMMVTLDICEKILKCAKHSYYVGGHTFFVTASIGAVLFGSEEMAIQGDLIRHADVAMYEAKKRGKDQVVFFEEAIETRLNEQVLIENKVRLALESESLVLHYQPKVNREGMVIGLEALVRIREDDGSLIYPDRFITLCEERNLIVSLSEKVLMEVCNTLKSWENDDRLALIDIAVNISPVWLSQPTFIENVEIILRESGADPHRLLFEITESIELTDIQNKMVVIERCANLGIRFSLDDFGTGYSSLAYIKELPLYEIKIDRSLIVQCGENMAGEKSENHNRFIRAIIVMSKSLGLIVTIEGIDTSTAAKALWEMGCDVIQGYFYSKPIDQKAVEVFILENHLQIPTNNKTSESDFIK
ncbi:MAG: EAL domain-containing protein [Sulfuricurvum sp.]|uniref:putative bifunctional diguanylate cyclase/phosphodiesterase n=1 Tax=Sulfuricurvum sp. TaxID=2025608 RepID=UPI0025E3C60D|nr:EAL domain-containing protein [Sulfuricurvum sp.]MCI4407278.1 EAL domain-containing protein [Sulfuricurvum sp.]